MSPRTTILCAVIAVVLMSLPAAKRQARAESDEFRVVAGERQLFLDDHDVAAVEDLQRTMHRPQKRGAVIRSPNPTKTIQTRTAPVWDSQAKLFKFWVLGIDENLWQSTDGLHWTPGPQTNMRITMAVYDAHDPDPARRFKASLLNSGFAVSPDGAQWTQLDVPKIPSSDEGNLSYLPEHGLFIHTVKRGGTYGRSLALATSRDFNAWTDLGIVFQADEQDQRLGAMNITARMADATLHQTPYNEPEVYNVDVYNMGVFRYEGVYIGMPAMYHATGPVPNYPNTVGFHLIQLACSRDLKDWQRLGERQTFIGPSRTESGAYDLTQILPPSAPVVRDDELWFYYTGLKYRGSFTYVGTYPDGEHVPIPGRDRDTGAVCLAVLRRDGFVSLDADEHEGRIVTKPFTVSAAGLYVNMDARDGSLRAEVLDKLNNVLATSETLTGDLPQGELSWAHGDLADLKGKTVSLRFTLSSASLYSYWLAD